jgi:hypothetical protein
MLNVQNKNSRQASRLHQGKFEKQPFDEEARRNMFGQRAKKNGG